MGSKKWSGANVTKARAHWKKKLPLRCYLGCGGIVDGREAWVVEHIIPRSQGGDTLGVSNQWVSHRKCSDRQGGQMSAARLNAKRTVPVSNPWPW